MRLYKIFQDIILEEVNTSKTVLAEAVSSDSIDSIVNGVDGKHFHVRFDYRSPRGDITNRWVQIYDYVSTTANNDAVSAFEVSKDGVETGLWKIFRLDRIDNYSTSKVPFYKAISDRVNVPKFNKTGNRTPTISTVKNKATFNYNYAPSTIKQQQRSLNKNTTSVTPTPSTQQREIPKPETSQDYEEEEENEEEDENNN
jgi:predicted DNA-binding transcriptional regulator YafY